LTRLRAPCSREFRCNINRERERKKNAMNKQTDNQKTNKQTKHSINRHTNAGNSRQKFCFPYWDGKVTASRSTFQPASHLWTHPPNVDCQRKSWAYTSSERPQGAEIPLTVGNGKE
jgi:hypothetical protein